MSGNRSRIFKADLLPALLAFALSLTLYLFTLSPTISVGDSPELTASAFTLGIAHPPGYPLFSLLGKAASVVPGGSFAFKVNFMSAFLGGLSVLFLYMGILEVICLIRNWQLAGTTGKPQLVDRLSALIGSMTFAVSPIFWSQAVVAEVYTLNAALFTCLIWLGLKWSGRRSVESKDQTPVHGLRILYLIAFLWGLSLANHHTMIAFGPLFLFYMLWHAVKKESSTPFTVQFSLFILFLFLGLSVYLYFPVRSAQDPFMDWGDAERISGFMDLIQRKQFGMGSRAYSVERVSAQVQYYFDVLADQFAFPGVLLGCMGALLLAGRYLKAFIFTAALFLVHGILTVLVLNPAPEDLYSMDVMIIPSFIVFSLWTGVGTLFGYSGVMALFFRILTAQKEKAIIAVMSLFFLATPLYLTYANFQANDRSGDSFARDYAMDVLEALELEGVVFVEADLSLFPLWYMQCVEGERRDVAVLDVDMLMLPWFKKQLKEKYPNMEIKVPDVVKHSKGKGYKPLSLEAIEAYKVSQTEGMLDALMDKYPVYFSYEFGLPFKEFGERRDIFLHRRGIVFRASKEMFPDEPLGDFHAVDSVVKAAQGKDEEVLFIGMAYVPAIERLASVELNSGRRGRAMELMEGILTIDPYNATSLNNLAFMYAEEGRELNRAEEMVRRAMAVRPLEKMRHLKTLGFIYMKRGEYVQAVEAFNEVLKREPGSEWTGSRLEEARKAMNMQAVSP